MKYIAIALSEIGKIRQNNEDNLYFDSMIRSVQVDASFRKTLSGDEAVKLFAVCDGMGGESMGEEASYLAVSGLQEVERHFKQDGGRSFSKLISRYLNRVNEAICQNVRNNNGRRMGSTFACLIFREQVAQTLNIGDSKIFLFRNGKLHQLSVNHTHAQKLLDMGIITEEEAKQHPERHRLTQHLGMFAEEGKIQPALSPEIWVQKGDIFLLCSDGITEMLHEAELTEILMSPLPFMQQADKLMQAAQDAGGKDNATLVLIRIQEVESEEAVDLPDLHPQAFGQEQEDLPGKSGRSEGAVTKSPIEGAPVAERSKRNNKPLFAEAPVVSRVANPYQPTEEELARFEQAKQAAYARKQEQLKLQQAQYQDTITGRLSAKFTAVERPDQRGEVTSRAKRANRLGPTVGQVIGRAILSFLIFVIIGFGLAFLLMNIEVVKRLLDRLIG